MEFEKLQSIIAEVLNVDADEIRPETTFVDDLGADSLDVFRIGGGCRRGDQKCDRVRQGGFLSLLFKRMKVSGNEKK